MRKFSMLKFALLTLLVSLVSMQIVCVKNANAADPLLQATFTTSPTTVAPGNDGYIQLSLKNSGTVAADRVRITYFSNDPSIIPSGTWIADLSPVGAGETTTSLFKFHVPENAAPGLYAITFYISYGADSTTKTINPNAIVNVQSPSALELTSIKPSSLKPGEKTNMTFTITNKGSSSINNIVFSWTSSGNVILPLGTDNRVIIPAISANSYYDIKVEVSVSPTATPGTYPLTISINYVDKSGTNQTISSTAGVEIGGETDFDVSIQDSTSGTTTLAIANIGTNTAYSAIVSIPQQDNFRATGTSTSIIGNLNAGDYTLASFQITSTSIGTITNISANQQRNLIVKISYTDTLGVRRTIQKEVSQEGTAGLITNGTFDRSSFGTGSRTQSSGTILGISSSNGLLYIVIGIVGIAVIVIFLKFKKLLSRLKTLLGLLLMKMKIKRNKE